MRITEVFSRIRGSRLSSRMSLLVAALVGGVVVFGGQTAMRFVHGGSSGNQPLAVVDGKPISLSMFHAEMTRRGGEAAFSSPQQRRSLLDEMIRVLAGAGALARPRTVCTRSSPRRRRPTGHIRRISI